MAQFNVPLHSHHQLITDGNWLVCSPALHASISLKVTRDVPTSHLILASKQIFDESVSVISLPWAIEYRPLGLIGAVTSLQLQNKTKQNKVSLLSFAFGYLIETLLHSLAPWKISVSTSPRTFQQTPVFKRIASRTHLMIGTRNRDGSGVTRIWREGHGRMAALGFTMMKSF